MNLDTIDNSNISDNQELMHGGVDYNQLVNTATIINSNIDTQQNSTTAPVSRLEQLKSKKVNNQESGLKTVSGGSGKIDQSFIPLDQTNIFADSTPQANFVPVQDIFQPIPKPFEAVTQSQDEFPVFSFPSVAQTLPEIQQPTQNIPQIPGSFVPLDQAGIFPTNPDLNLNSAPAGFVSVSEGLNTQPVINNLPTAAKIGEDIQITPVQSTEKQASTAPVVVQTAALPVSDTFDEVVQPKKPVDVLKEKIKEFKNVAGGANALQEYLNTSVSNNSVTVNNL